jgi:AraC-like DNA-binding protein
VARRRKDRAVLHADRRRYERIIDIYLKDCYARRTPARASELAAKLDVNRQHLGRVIRRLFGKPLSEVLCTKQLDYAARLLRHRRLRVDDIGQAAAFGHRSTFYRVFKERFGMTPDEYRCESAKVRLDKSHPD